MNLELVENAKRITKSPKSYFGLRLHSKPSEETEKEEILACLKQAKKEMEAVYKNFDNTTDEDLVDSYVYELKALQLKYQYLLKLAKQYGIVAMGEQEIS